MKAKKARRRGNPDPVVLADIVNRIVEAAEPEKIVLFGSAARGEMGPDSDLDLLVIKGGKFRRDRLTVAIYRTLRGKDAAVDVVVVTPEEVERYRNWPRKRGQVKYSPSATFSFSLFPRWGRNNKTKEKILFLCEEIKGGF